MFPLRRIVYTMKYRSHAILYRHSGAPLGGPAPFPPPQTALGARQPSLPIGSDPGRRHPVIFCALLSSHIQANRLRAPASLICFVYRATWTCIWSAGGALSVNPSARWTCINNSRLTCHRQEPPTPTPEGRFSRLAAE